MSLKPLINNQNIIIDDHKRGSKEIKDWDNPANDIHIDKETKYKIDGKKQKIKIRIPINSNRDISITNKSGFKIELPKKLKKEIIKAFENKKTRDVFVKELIPIIDNFSSNIENIEKAKLTLDKIAKHFDLEWKTQEIINKYQKILIEYTQIYQDNKEQYYITINSSRIKISNVDNWYRAIHKIRRNHIE